MKYLFAIIFFLIICANLYSQIINIPTDQPTIQAGINSAVNGDTVLVAEGTYFENINFKGKAIIVASHFLIDEDTSHISKTIIDGSQPTNSDSGSVVYFISGEDTTSVLMGFTITGGTGTPVFVGAPRLGRVGGGIYILDAGAKICNNYIYKNTVADSFVVLGGGLTAGPPSSNSFVIIEKNVFDSNACLRSEFASHGGGMSITIKATVKDNIFSNNIVSSNNGEAFGGGFAALFNLDQLIVDHNLIINNKVETLFGTDSLDGALGGGFMIWNDMTANARIVNNIIANNEVSSSNWSAGAGVCFEDVEGDVIFANNLIYDNFYSGTVDCHGTGIGILDNSVLRILNNTITGNEPSPNGGALSTWNTISTTAINNIFWGNSSGTAKPEIDVWEGKTADVFYSNVQGGWEGEGNIDVNPMFEDSLFNVSDSSYCVGNGIVSIEINGTTYESPSLDFYGNARPNSIDPYVDIGAIESPYKRNQIVSVNDNANELPTKFHLAQNYPNPFNPSTTIKYQIPNKTHPSIPSREGKERSDRGVLVTLKVYDILGREIATLVNQKQKPGYYEVAWDASNQPSGVYFYKMQAGSYVETKKMILLR